MWVAFGGVKSWPAGDQFAALQGSGSVPGCVGTPSFTAGVVVAYARAAHRMNQGGDFGAKTPFDVAPGLLSPRSPEDLRRDLL